MVALDEIIIHLICDIIDSMQLVRGSHTTSPYQSTIVALNLMLRVKEGKKEKAHTLSFSKEHPQRLIKFCNSISNEENLTSHLSLWRKFNKCLVEFDFRDKLTCIEANIQHAPSD